jgi:sec-independent protein translocase protein TatA
MNVELALLGLGGWEIVFVLAIILLLFGATRLPKLAKGIAESILEFKKASRESLEVEKRKSAKEKPPESKDDPATSGG